MKEEKMGEAGPQFAIQVIDATKDGEILKFTVQTKLLVNFIELSDHMFVGESRILIIFLCII